MAEWVDDIIEQRQRRTVQSVYTLGMACFVAGLQLIWRSGAFDRDALNTILDSYSLARIGLRVWGYMR